jgi:hypothetical protein
MRFFAGRLARIREGEERPDRTLQEGGLKSRLQPVVRSTVVSAVDIVPQSA